MCSLQPHGRGGLAVTPGPNMLYLVSRSLAQGTGAGMVSLVGCQFGSLLVMLCAAAGITAALFAIPYAWDALRLGGAAYLAWLALCLLPLAVDLAADERLPAIRQHEPDRRKRCARAKANLCERRRKAARANLADDCERALTHDLDEQKHRCAHPFVFDQNSVVVVCNDLRQQLVQQRKRLRVRNCVPVQLSLIGRADERLQRGVIEFAEIRRALLNGARELGRTRG